MSRLHWTLLLSLALFGCKASDVDADGYDDKEDCDDENPDAYPGAEEVCDFADNDCDGMVDEEAVDMLTFYEDADGDGFGDPGTAVQACEAPAGMIEDGSDCDDADAAIHPGADELCNEIDDDCDSIVDEEAIDMITWYADADGDDYGDPDRPAESCDEPEGHADNPYDCDDDDYSIHPEADEYCNDIDDDCDGTVDEDAVDSRTWYYDGDGDGYGNPGADEDSCDQPEGYVADASDCDDFDPNQHPGADEYCNGEDDDCDGDIDEDPVDGDLYYADDDADDFGDPDDYINACEQPSGYVDNDWDCNDADSGEPQVADASLGSSSGDGSSASPFDSVQDAIDMALECVVAFQGTYYESIDFDGKDLVVTGVEGADDTIIDGTGLGVAVATFEGGESSSAVLQGFTLEGGDGDLTTSSNSYSCGSASTCTDYYSTYCGGGVYVSASDPTLNDLIVQDNLLAAASTTSSGNDTYYVYSFGGGLCFLGSSSEVSDLEIYENFADQGGGIYADETSDVDLSRSWLIANESSDGAGMEVELGSMTVTNVASTWNEAATSGGGLLVIDGTLEATNITSGGDEAPSGGAVYASGTGSIDLYNSIVYGSGAEGVLVDSTASYWGTYNNVYGNSTDYSGITDPTGLSGNLSDDPLFTSVTDDGNPYNDDWTLGTGSPSIDAGNTSSTYDDADGTVNDQGAFGGPDSDWDS